MIKERKDLRLYGGDFFCVLSIVCIDVAAILLPERNRAHGESEGEYVTMGTKERRDCISWIRYLAESFGEDTKVFLRGVSIDGDTVLSISGESDMPGRVIGTVSDCGFSSSEEPFECQIRNPYHIPPTFIVRICQMKKGSHFHGNESLLQFELRGFEM